MKGAGSHLLVFLFLSFLSKNLAGDVYWPEDQELRRTWNHVLFLDHCLESDEGLNERDIDYIKGMVRDLIRMDETGCTNDRRAGFVAAYVRLAWHDAATFDVNDHSGGAHARMRLPGNPENTDPDNVGLDGYYTLLKYNQNFFSDRLSEADMWVIAALTAVEYGGGPSIPFHYGREDSWDYETGYADRLPQGYLRAHDQKVHLLPHLREIFERLGFDDVDRALVSLSGAHNLGGIRHFRSGFVPDTTDELPWSPLGIYFHNAFYSELLYQRWWESDVEDPDLKVTVKSDNRTFMLLSDQALLFDQPLVDLVELYANDKNKWFEDFATYYQQVLEISYDETLKDVEPAYLWDEGEWELCSVWCGGGIQYREVSCMEYPSWNLAGDELCEWSRYGGEKPVYSQPCNSQTCEQYVWTYGEWTECNEVCGGGVRSRDLQCMNTETGDNVDESYCEAYVEPPSLEACNVDECGYWKQIFGTEGECDIVCENSNLLIDFPHYTSVWTGSQTAEFQCMKEFEGNPRPVGEEWCDEWDKPMYAPCVDRFCIDRLPHWQVTAWSDCSAECEGGIQTREVSCWAKPPPDHLLLEELPLEDCINVPKYTLPDIPLEYTLPDGIQLPPLPDQWTSVPPLTERSCNIRPCRANIRKDGISASSDVGGSSATSYASTSNSASVVPPESASASISTSSNLEPESNPSKNLGGSITDTTSESRESNAKGDQQTTSGREVQQKEMEVVDEEGVNVSLVIGLSLAGVALIGLGCYGGRRYHKRKSIQTDETTPLHDVCGSPTVAGSYQNSSPPDQLQAQHNFR